MAIIRRRRLQWVRTPEAEDTGMDQHVNEYLETRRPFEWRRALGAAAGGRRRPLAKLVAWRKRRRAIRDLYALDDRMLADIGLSRAQIRPLVEDLLDAGAAGPSAANDNRAATAA
jgi:uncharacterized protein YjiS (DUF1127 family)